jgi:hypothetical protein
MRVAQRLPMDGLFERHRTPRYVVAHGILSLLPRHSRNKVRGEVRISNAVHAGSSWKTANQRFSSVKGPAMEANGICRSCDC